MATMTMTESTPTQPQAKTQLPISRSPNVDNLDRHGYLFGQKLTASMSPLLHHVVYQNLGLNWGQERLDSTDMNLFLRLIQHPNFYGASVTMPHKVAIIPHLDELTPECRAVGACNTLFIREERGRRLFCGTNTDVVGVKESFLRNVASPAAVFEGRPGLVVGGGGAARSAVYALRQWLGATAIYLVNRDRAEVDAVVAECAARGYGGRLVHVATVEQAEALEGPGAVVACVPDLPPATDEELAARAVTEVFLSGKEHKGAMLEMCYNPSPYTELGALAEKAGWQVILGTEALIWQGIEQDKYWTGRSAEELPVKEVKEEIARQLAQRSRI